MRTDIHRPSAIKPQEYEYVCVQYTDIKGIGGAAFMKAEREMRDRHMARTGGTYSNHEHGGNCMVCGNANAIYTLLFYHQPTNSYVYTGHECAVKMEMGFDTKRFSAFRKQVQSALEHKAGKAKAEKILADAGLTRCWELYVIPASGENNFKYEELTIRDIAGKLVKYGSVSDNQMNFLRSLLTKIDNRAVIAQQRKAEMESAAMCPDGRVTVTGKILTTRDHASDFGMVVKMLVKDDTGFLVWGTMPRSLDASKGDRVVFSAEVEPKQDDPKFGFFRRPTKAKNLSTPETPATESTDSPDSLLQTI